MKMVDDKSQIFIHSNDIYCYLCYYQVLNLSLESTNFFVRLDVALKLPSILYFTLFNLVAALSQPIVTLQ